MKLLALGAAVILFPLCSYGQSYADSPFSVVDAVPASAQVEGYAHGTSRANGVWIDPFVSRSEFAINKVGRLMIAGDVDGAKPAQMQHFFVQYVDLGATYGYNLLLEPLAGTDRIKCTFSQLTDPPAPWWSRDKSIAPFALPADLTPLVIHSGQVIAIATHPAGKDNPAVIHYLQLTRMDAAQGTEAKAE